MVFLPASKDKSHPSVKSRPSTARKRQPARATQPVRRQPGRPQKFSEDERRAQLIDVAEHAFLETGYGATSMDDIARRAGMSKKTLYQLFDTKEVLFAAVVEARMLSFTASVEIDLDRPVDEILYGLLVEVANFVLVPRRIAMLRLAIAESPRSPELANAFYRCGPKRGCSKLTKLLADLSERGLLKIEDAHASANMLFSMAVGEYHMHSLIGANTRPSQDAIESRVRIAVTTFLDGTRRKT